MKKKGGRGVRFRGGAAGAIPLVFFAALVLSGGAEFALAAAAAAVVHEAGHLAAAAVLGAPLGSVGAAPCGVRLFFDFSNLSPAREIAVLLAGPASSAAASLLAAHTSLPYRRGGMFFVLTGFALAALNLLPVRGLDGGGILSAILSATVLPDREEAATRRVSAVFTALFLALAAAVQVLRGANLSLLLLALYFLAERER